MPLVHMHNIHFFLVFQPCRGGEMDYQKGEALSGAAPRQQQLNESSAIVYTPSDLGIDIQQDTLSADGPSDDMFRIKLLKSAFSMMRQTKLQTLKRRDRSAEKDPAFAELVQYVDDMFSALKIRDALKQSKCIVLMHLPFNLHWFLLLSDDGYYYEIQPYFTTSPNFGEIEFFLRQEGFTEVDRILAAVRALPVYNDNFTETIVTALNTLTTRTLTTFDCVRYFSERISRPDNYSAWLQEGYLNSLAESADNIVHVVCAAYKTISPDALLRQEDCWSDLIARNRSSKDGMRAIRIYMQQEVAIIMSDLFNKIDGREASLQLAHYTEIFQRVPSPDELNVYHNKFIRTAVRMMKESNNSQDGVDPRIKQVEGYIQMHYSDRLQMSQLASVAGLSTTYLSCLFRQETGSTVVDYIRNIRICKAKTLLRYADIPVTEVAWQCGYQDNSYFTREFKKASGCSPLEYRKKITNQNK
jgi:AraC-like DNA-binding protein